MDYSTLTNKQLMAECESRGLPTYGAKPALIARLHKHDEQIDTLQENPTVTDDDFPDLGEDTSDSLTEPAVPVQIRAGAGKTADAELEGLKAEMRAELAAMRAERAAASGEKVTAGERASDSAIDRVRNTERVFRAEYPLPKAAALGDELHAAFCQQIADDARAAGYKVCGGGRRYGWGTNDAGQRVERYEIYARKQ